MPSGKVISILTADVPRGTDVVKVSIGPEKEIFTIHKNLICASSDFFDRAFNGRFIEAAEQTINLPEEDVIPFRFYRNLLYSDRISSDIDAYLKQDEEKICEADEFWVRVWRMADHLLITRLQEIAVEEFETIFSAKVGAIPSEGLIFEIYEEETPSYFKLHLLYHLAFWHKTGVTSKLLSIMDTRRDFRLDYLHTVINLHAVFLPNPVAHPQRCEANVICGYYDARSEVTSQVAKDKDSEEQKASSTSDPERTQSETPDECKEPPRRRRILPNTNLGTTYDGLAYQPRTWTTTLGGGRHSTRHT